MIEIKDMAVLEALIEYRYEPVLVQILRDIGRQGGFRLVNARPGDDCLPVREVWLCPDYWDGGQMDRIVHNINRVWQYNGMPDRLVMVYESDFRGQRVRVRVCESTKRWI
jgi:hypothetical protein